MFSFIVYEKKILTVMVNNITKINKTNNHPTLQLTEHTQNNHPTPQLTEHTQNNHPTPQLTEHTQQKHNIPGWKSRSWLGTGIKIWRG
jgi:hypothetical protein